MTVVLLVSDLRVSVLGPDKKMAAELDTVISQLFPPQCVFHVLWYPQDMPPFFQLPQFLRFTCTPLTNMSCGVSIPKVKPVSPLNKYYLANRFFLRLKAMEERISKGGGN